MEDQDIDLDELDAAYDEDLDKDAVQSDQDSEKAQQELGSNEPQPQ